MTTEKPEQIPNIIIKRATPNDSHDIWEWRNDILTKQMSISSESVAWDSHHNWFEKSLLNANRYLYIGYINNNKIGMCRFDIDSDTTSAEVSINLNPAYRNQKLSHPLLSKAIQVFLEEKKIYLTATIKKINTSSAKCFSKVGFVIDHEDSEYNYYKYSV